MLKGGADPYSQPALDKHTAQEQLSAKCLTHYLPEGDRICSTLEWRLNVEQIANILAGP